jgi:hypothetical protein
VCFVVRKTTSEQEHAILTTLYLPDVKNIDSWRARKGHLQRSFPLDVLMIPSSVVTVAANGECLTCGGFSLSETICLRNFGFITDYFDDLSLSSRRGNEGATFMGSTRGGAPTPRWAMIEGSAEEFLTVSSGEGSFGLPAFRWCGAGASITPTFYKNKIFVHIGVHIKMHIKL